MSFNAVITLERLKQLTNNTYELHFIMAPVDSNNKLFISFLLLVPLCFVLIQNCRVLSFIEFTVCRKQKGIQLLLFLLIFHVFIESLSIVTRIFCLSFPVT